MFAGIKAKEESAVGQNIQVSKYGDQKGTNINILEIWIVFNVNSQIKL